MYKYMNEYDYNLKFEINDDYFHFVMAFVFAYHPFNEISIFFYFLAFMYNNILKISFNIIENKKNDLNHLN